MTVAIEPVDTLVVGPTGSGKELLAQLIHAEARCPGPFVPVNCACLSKELGLAELFGHTKGAFTGASRQRDGLIRQANGGTLFLDELGELSAALQAALLRALQEREVRPVGAMVAIPFDVRIVSATHRDLEAMVAAGTFREDLYNRLAGFTLTVPPLKDRGADFDLLVRHVMKTDPVCSKRTLRFSRAARQRLRQHDWPGNVRELHRSLRQLCLAHTKMRVTAEDLKRILGLPDLLCAHQVKCPEEAILEIVQQQGETSISAIIDGLGMSRSTALRHLRQLVSNGALLRVGKKGRGVRYRLSGGPSPPLAQTAKLLQQANETELTQREQAALVLAQSGQMTRASLCEELELAPRTATRLLVKLANRGLLIASGSSARTRSYHLPSAAPCHP